MIKFLSSSVILVKDAAITNGMIVEDEIEMPVNPSDWAETFTSGGLIDMNIGTMVAPSTRQSSAFKARDLSMFMAVNPVGSPVRSRCTVPQKAYGEDATVDIYTCKYKHFEERENIGKPFY